MLDLDKPKYTRHQSQGRSSHVGSAVSCCRSIRAMCLHYHRCDMVLFMTTQNHTYVGIRISCCCMQGRCICTDDLHGAEAVDITVHSSRFAVNYACMCSCDGTFTAVDACLSADRELNTVAFDLGHESRNLIWSKTKYVVW